MDTPESFVIIRKEIKELKDDENKLFENLKFVQAKIKNLYKKFPRCSSCGRNTDPIYMTIATQEDIDDYFDRDEGYSGPDIGEYYCGC